MTIGEEIIVPRIVDDSLELINGKYSQLKLADIIALEFFALTYSYSVKELFIVLAKNLTHLSVVIGS